MVDQLTLQTIGIGIAAASVVVGVLNSILMSRRAERHRQTDIETRQARLFMQIYDHYNDREFAKMLAESQWLWEWDDDDDGWEKYGPETNIDAYSTWASVFNYFKGVGVLVKRKQIDIGVVNDLMSSFLVPLWKKWEPMIKIHRERYNLPTAWEGAEYLYNECMKYIEEHPELKT